MRTDLSPRDRPHGHRLTAGLRWAGLVLVLALALAGVSVIAFDQAGLLAPGEPFRESAYAAAPSVVPGGMARLPAAPGRLVAAAQALPAADARSSPHSSVLPPLQGRQGRLLDLQGQAVADYLAPRWAAARQGQVQAAYEVYLALSLCSAAEARVPDDEDPAEARRLREERELARLRCAGISPRQREEGRHWLAHAAAAGHPQAQVDFYLEGRLDLSQGLATMDDSARQAWEQSAAAHLEAAALHCEPEAMGLLASHFDAPELSSTPDAAKALRYAVAAALARHQPLREAHLRQRYAADLPPEAAQAAIDSGVQLARAACRP